MARPAHARATGAPSVPLLFAMIFASQLALTIFLPAVPDIARDLGTSLTRTQWIIPAYLGAFALSVEHIELLEHPSGALGCDLNPFLNCSGAIESDQGKLFGFPNPLLGIGGFAIVITIGAAMLAGARFADWFKISFAVGTVLAAVFIGQIRTAHH